MPAIAFVRGGEFSTGVMGIIAPAVTLAGTIGRLHLMERSELSAHVKRLRQELEIMYTMAQRAQTQNWLISEQCLPDMSAMPIDSFLDGIRDIVAACEPEALQNGLGVEVDLDQAMNLPERARVRTDLALFRAGLGNLLDNARKYSFPNSTVYVHAIATRDQHLDVSVANTGITLSYEEAKQCRERGWRSANARRHTEKGLGLGLWIANRIVERLEGQLLVEATDARGVTRFGIRLPLQDKQ
jgi:signal transduction histidine kinase